MTPIYKNIGMASACALCILIAGCNNNNTKNGTTTNTDSTAQTSTTNTDTTSRVKQAEGSVEQGVNNAATAAKEAMARNPDSTFVATVAVANNEEIKVLQAGIDKGTDKELKAHARMMIKDHEGLAKKINSYAASKNYTIPTDDNGKGDQDLNNMANKSGADWDKAWLNFMYNAHEKAIGEFEGAKKEVKDPALVAIIDNTLPTLHRHLDMVKSLLDKMK